MTNTTTDFIVQDHGSLVILLPRTTAAKEWIDEYIPEDAQKWANGSVIERRYFGDIYEGITADGLSIS